MLSLVVPEATHSRNVKAAGGARESGVWVGTIRLR
jgi:hypothetical protein